MEVKYIAYENQLTPIWDVIIFKLTVHGLLVIISFKKIYCVL